MKSYKLLLTLLVSVFMISGNLFSQEYQHKERDTDGKRMRAKLEKKLHLSDEQVNKVESLKLEFRKEIIDLKANVGKKEIELEQLKNTLNFSREEYLKKVNDIISARNKIDLARANHQMDIYQLLNKDQQKEWNKMTRRMQDGKHLIKRKIKDIDIN